MPASPVTTDTDLATFTVKAGGVNVDARFEVLSIQVERALNRLPAARIIVRDGSAADENFAAASSTDFKPGAKIDILLGYHSHNASVFSGILVRSAVQVERDGHTALVLHCRDTAVSMTVGRRSGCFLNTTDHDALTTVINRHSGLRADVAATTGQIEQLTQFAASDWDFLLARAEANGLVVNVVDGKVSVVAPNFSDSPALNVTYGFDLIEAALEEDARTQLASVACASWDPAIQALIKTTESTKNSNTLGADRAAALAQVAGGRPFPLVTATPQAAADLKTWAEAQLIKSELAKIRGTVRFQGNAGLLPAHLLDISGLGERFDGKAFVSGVIHELSEGQWTTVATVGLDPAWFAARPDVSAPSAAALLPGVPGIQIGTVKQIQEDPGKQFRVLVTVPTVDSEGHALWARLARPYATNNAGWFFYPEVGDEVLLAFLDGDPRYPVIIGSLHSGPRPPPLPVEKPNNQKGIVTRAQLKVLFDEEKKIITLRTPAGNTAVLSDDAKSITLTDENGNSAKLGTDGITLTSASNIVLKAAQNISLTADAGTVTVKGTQGVTVSGLTVSLTADTEFSATGNASAKLTASGQTQIQGAMVMIN